jgi:hypothetical protein
MVCKNRITIIGFLGQHAETRPQYLRRHCLHSLFPCNESELESERNGRIQHAHGMAPLHQLE